ncbi:DUF2312 domain-containing protein [Kiloniella laminariae]|uniref:DUF2312 domain-containing protein n=1 Tax=Kiloniella laminariae TaxID=454162 RepID=UPI002F35EB56
MSDFESDFDEDVSDNSFDSDVSNSDAAPVPGEIAGVTADRLRGFIERIERLEEEKKGLSDDIKEIYAESKSLGFDTKIMRKIVSLRKLETQERMEQEELIEVYKHALGMG